MKIVYTLSSEERAVIKDIEKAIFELDFQRKGALSMILRQQNLSGNYEFRDYSFIQHEPPPAAISTSSPAQAKAKAS